MRCVTHTLEMLLTVCLARVLSATLLHSMNSLSIFPLLIPPVILALNGSPTEWALFILDPLTDQNVIRIRQELGPKSIWPLFRLSRVYIWTMNRVRSKYV